MTTKEEQQALWARIYGALSPERRRIADDILKRCLDNALHQLGWAEELLELADSLIAAGATPAPWPIVGLFWIRLHGVMTELVEANWISADIARTLNEGELARNLSKFGLAVFTDGRAMLAALEKQEAVVADYLRQRSAHMRQDQYRVTEFVREDHHEEPEPAPGLNPPTRGSLCVSRAAWTAARPIACRRASRPALRCTP